MKDEKSFKEWAKASAEECWKNDEVKVFPMAAEKGVRVPFAMKMMLKEIYKLGFVNGVAQKIQYDQEDDDGAEQW